MESDSAARGTRAADVSVVICAYTLDRWADIVGAVESVRRQDPPPGEVLLVVDHNDALLARANLELDGCRVMTNTGAPGLSGARNTGVQAAIGSVVAFLDDDAAAEPGWLAALIAPYADPRVIGTGGWADPVWPGARPGWMPNEFDWVVGCSYRGLPTRRATVRNPIGCNMSFRREALIEVGGFRSEVGRVGKLPAGCEETELSIRLTQRRPGTSIVLEPRSRVRHRVTPDRVRWAYFRSRCYHEGRSKAIVGQLAGRRDGLSAEIRHTLGVLPAGVLRGLGATLRGDRSGVARAGAIVAGLAFTTFGFLEVSLRSRAGRRRRPAEAA